MTSAKIPKGSRTTRKRRKNRVNFPKGIKNAHIHETNEHHCEILEVPAISVQMHYHLPQCIFPNETYNYC
jgi:hypothetical protein